MDYLYEHFTKSLQNFSLLSENVPKRTITSMFKIQSESTFFLFDVDFSAEDKLVYRFELPSVLKF